MRSVHRSPPKGVPRAMLRRTASTSDFVCAELTRSSQLRGAQNRDIQLRAIVREDCGDHQRICLQRTDWGRRLENKWKKSSKRPPY